MQYQQPARPLLALPMFDPSAWSQIENDRDAKRNFVGNWIYGVIEKVDPNNVAKITGMLLDENVVD